MKVDWSPAALDDLRELSGFYQGDGDDYGAKIVMEAFHVSELLASHPELGRRIPALSAKSADVRRVIVLERYRMTYVVTTGRILINALEDSRAAKI